MKKSRHLIQAVLLAVLLVVMTAFPAFAASNPKPFHDDSMTGQQTTSSFVSGNYVTSDADVDGILFAAGNEVKAGGTSEYAMVAGNVLDVTDTVEKDAFLAGRVINLNGTVGRDCYAAAQEVNLNGQIAGNAYATGATVSINGVIQGDVYLSANQIRVSDDAEIHGQLHYNSNAIINAPQAVMAHAESYVNENANTNTNEVEVNEKPSILNEIKSRVISYLGLIVIALLALWLTPTWQKLDRDYSGKNFGTYAKTFGIGFGILAAVPVAFILLLISGVGVRLAFVLIFGYVAAILMAPIFLGFFLGKLVWRRLLHMENRIWAELLIGIAVYKIVTWVPGLGVAASLIAVPFGVGALVLLILGNKKDYFDNMPMVPQVTETME